MICKEQARKAVQSSLTCRNARLTLRVHRLVSPLAMRHKVEVESVTVPSLRILYNERNHGEGSTGTG